MINILAIPGSLRLNSSSNQILNAIVALTPKDVSIEIFKGVGYIPHFNDAEDTPEAVAVFREKIKNADAVLICTPEYAFGVPGSLKNAIDWTVSSGEFIDKPLGFITASTHGEKGHAAMRFIFTAIPAKVIDDALLLISFVRSKLDAAGNVKDPVVLNDLNKVLFSLIQSVR
jgi:chromate reductase, NAD(P)H dehydrogenase (quinone)